MTAKCQAGGCMKAAVVVTWYETLDNGRQKRAHCEGHGQEFWARTRRDPKFFRVAQFPVETLAVPGVPKLDHDGAQMYDDEGRPAFDVPPEKPHTHPLDIMDPDALAASLTRGSRWI